MVNKNSKLDLLDELVALNRERVDKYYEDKIFDQTQDEELAKQFKPVVNAINEWIAVANKYPNIMRNCICCFKKAKKRVNELKGFYSHLMVYVFVNVFILIVIYLNKHGDEEDFWRPETFFTAFFWGIGLLIHGLYTFNVPFFLGKDWEERKIKEILSNRKN